MDRSDVLVLLPKSSWFGGAFFLLAITCSMPAMAQKACPTPPAAVRDLDVPRFYGDKAGTVVDPGLDQAHKAAVAPLTAFLREVTSATDKALRRKDAGAAQCPLAWIEAWARGDAWLGKMGTRQAEYQRKWDLAGVALAYLKLRSLATPGQRAVIEPWLIRFADKARAFFDDPARARNNHWYWLGLGLAATSMATDSARHWTEARQIMTDAARDIAADGTIKAELAREKRALHYHTFAVTPLVAMAELAARRGEDWYASGNGALHRLVAVSVDGLRSPALFDRLAGHAQEPSPGTGSGWLTLYTERFPGKLKGSLPDVPPRHRWLGGDVAVLKAVLAGRDHSKPQ